MLFTYDKWKSELWENYCCFEGKKSDAIYPSQLETFYAGRGKRDFSGAWGQMPQAFESLNLEPTDLDNLMAGRGKKAGSNNNNNAVDDVMTFYAGRGKRDTRSIDSKDDIESKNVFFALRGWKALVRFAMWLHFFQANLFVLILPYILRSWTNDMRLAKKDSHFAIWT